MKKYFILSFLLLGGMLANAQGKKDSCVDEKPLTAPAFRKMMRQHYSFTILGNQTPATGFKVETIKPEITVKGNVFTSKKKDLIANLELTGGLNNGMMQLLSGTNLDGYLKVNLGFNVLLPYNSSQYIVDGKKKCLLLAAVELNKMKVAAYVDTMVALKAIIEDAQSPQTLFDDVVAASVIERNKLKHRMKTLEGYTVDKTHMSKLMIDLIRKYGGTMDAANIEGSYTLFKAQMKNNESSVIKIRELVDACNKLEKLGQEDNNYLDEKQWDYEIEAFENIWTSKRITWINFSAIANNSSFKLFDGVQLIDSSSFLPGLNVSFNFFRKWKEAHRFVYWRAGIGIHRTNSVRDMIKMDYKTQNVIQVSPTETLVKEKTGTAYIGQLNHGASFQLFFEGYFQHFQNQYLPGLYTKLEYNHADTWVNKNKLSLDLGIIWNLTNNDKDAKNVLSIVPYANWQNIFKEYTSNTKSEAKKPKDLFSVGLKFGVPVNLGKGSK